MPELAYQVVCGQEHCLCVSVDGRVFGWGLNHYGQVGVGNVEVVADPRLVLEDKNNFIDDIQAGLYASLAKSKQGSLFVWGLNQGPYTQNASMVVQVKNRFNDVVNFSCLDRSAIQMIPRQQKDLKVKKITAGYYHFGAIADNNQLYVWGDNADNCFGFDKFNDEQVTNLIFPHAVHLAQTVQDICFGGYHSLAKVQTH